MNRRRILIVGGSDAGTAAALAARSTDPECVIDVLLEDRVDTWHRQLERPTYLPLGTTAHKQGGCACRCHEPGAAVEFAGTVGTQIVKVFESRAGRTVSRRACPGRSWEATARF